MSKLLPSLRAKSAYHLPLELLKKEGKKVLLFDLDNTLASYYESFEDRELDARRLKETLEWQGFRMVIASNGRGKRVKDFAKKLGVPCFPMLLKPFAFRLKKALQQNGIKKEEACLIGDQMLTDLKAAKKAGIFFVLTDPLQEKEPFFTRINRHFERKKRKNIANMPYDVLIRGRDNYE